MDCFGNCHSDRCSLKDAETGDFLQKQDVDIRGSDMEITVREREREGGRDKEKCERE